jgi:ABC-type multidrug transport system fused ATPase/permease subunit
VSQPPTDAKKADAAGLSMQSMVPEISNRELTFWMFRFLKPVRGLAILCCSMVAFNAVLEIGTVDQTGNAITAIQNIAINGAPPTQDSFWGWFTGSDPLVVSLRKLVLLWTAVTLSILVLRFVRELVNNKFSMDGVYYIREAVYDKIQRVGLGFHDAVSSGQLINRALTDLQNVRNFVQNSLMQIVDIAVAVPLYMAFMWTINPWLALLALVPLPIWTIYIMRFSKRVQPAAKAAMESDDRNVSLISENIAGVHVVKAFATEAAEIGKFNENADVFKDRVLKRIRLFANFHPVIRGVASASHLSLFLLAGILILLYKGTKVVVGDLQKLGMGMGAVLNRLQGIAGINEQYQNAIVSARRLYEVLAATPTVPEPPHVKPLPVGSGEVVFENVCFTYGNVEANGKEVLHDLSFRVPAGSVVAIVGPTGAGKSTLVNLVARFYDPRSGRILIDGVDIRDVTLGSLRTQVSFVFQETYLFSDTVTSNIAYGRPGVSAGDVEAAARLAQAHEFIEALPKGYDTLLGERGTTLSGGQRQRLAIARAIVTNPRILILDDATAAVDSETEDLIRRGMKFVMAGRTTFIIAHRISTVKRADMVLVLEHGRITQQGTHDELMRQGGHYREVAMVQLSHGEETTPKRPIDENPSHVKRMRDEQTVAAATAGKTRENESEAAAAE